MISMWKLIPYEHFQFKIYSVSTDSCSTSVFLFPGVGVRLFGFPFPMERFMKLFTLFPRTYFAIYKFSNYARNISLTLQLGKTLSYYISFYSNFEFSLKTGFFVLPPFPMNMDFIGSESWSIQGIGNNRLWTFPMKYKQD